MKSNISIEEILETAQDLIAVLDEIENDKSYKAMMILASARGFQYSGPSWDGLKDLLNKKINLYLKHKFDSASV